MSAHYQEWLSLFIRWLHFTVGIAWIGASFYFIFLENNLNRKEKLRDGLSGNLWAIHGGGIYYLEKFKCAPPEFPEHLHWFKWEAYWTWMSGMALLAVVYYLNPHTYLLDPSKASLGVGAAIGISLATVVVAWTIYDLMCRTKLIDMPLLLGLIGYVLAVGVTYGLSKIFTDRAAFIHTGAMLGTIMVGNVHRVIIPSQKALVAAAKEGKEPDPALGIYAGKRSRHNNYITLPVLFIMISSHYPVVYSHPYNWAIFAALALGSAVVRHYFNIRKTSASAKFILPGAACAFALLAFLTAPQPAAVSTRVVSIAEVQHVIQQRCQACHSATPTDDIFKVAPNGVIFDTQEQMKAFAERIKVRAAVVKNMPLMNKTGMTDDEREILGAWIP